MADTIQSEVDALERGRAAAEEYIAAQKNKLTEGDKLAVLRGAIENSLSRQALAAPGTYNPLYVEGQRDALRGVLDAMKEMGA